MSFTLLKATKRKARREHSCIWCPEPIPAGTQYVYERAVFDGDFQDHKYHPECLAACHVVAAQEGGECIIDPHGCKRGSTEQL